MSEELVEGLDFYFDEDGLMILTEHYLKKRGHCCKSGCLNCPYGFHDNYDPNVPQELYDPWSEEN